MRVFVSYSHADAAVADKVCGVLKDASVDYVRDIELIAPGDNIENKIEQALQACHALIVVVSQATRESEWVPYEVGQAKTLGKAVIPYLTDSSVSLPAYIGSLRFVSQLDEIRDYFSQESRPDLGTWERRALRIALKGIVTAYEFDKLFGLDLEGPFQVHYSHRMYEELRRLITLDFVTTTGGRIVDLLRLRERDGSDQSFDLKEYVAITQEGHEYVEMRRFLDSEQDDDRGQ